MKCLHTPTRWKKGEHFSPRETRTCDHSCYKPNRQALWTSQILHSCSPEARESLRCRQRFDAAWGLSYKLHSAACSSQRRHTQEHILSLPHTTGISVAIQPAACCRRPCRCRTQAAPTQTVTASAARGTSPIQVYQAPAMRRPLPLCASVQLKLASHKCEVDERMEDRARRHDCRSSDHYQQRGTCRKQACTALSTSLRRKQERHDMSTVHRL